MSEKILAEKNLIVRHRTIELVEHWAIAISGLLLLVTGIFELPVAKRYYIINVPGLGWSADFITSLYIHYAAALVLRSRESSIWSITDFAAKRDSCRKRVIWPLPLWS